LFSLSENVRRTRGDLSQRDFWHQITRDPGLSYGVVCVILGFAIFVELRLVTSRQTDRQTDTR